MRQGLARQQQATRAVVAVQRFTPGDRRFGGVARAPYVHLRDQAQARRVLHGLVGRPILAQPDGVMGEHVDDRQTHQCRHANGIAGVVRKRQEGATVRAKTAVQHQAVHDGRHAELTHSVVHVVASAASLERTVTFPVGQVRASQVGRSAKQFRHRRADLIEHVL